MSQEENVALARKAYDAFNRRDHDALADFVRPGRGIQLPDRRGGGRGVPRPRRNQEFFRREDEAFDRISVEIEQIFDFGDFVIIRAFFRAHGRESGVPVELDAWQVARVSARKRVMWWRFFRTRAEALEAAAGLSE